MSYATYLASRGYRRVTVERSSLAAEANHLVLDRLDRPVRRIEAPDQPAERIPAARKVVAIRGRG